MHEAPRAHGGEIVSERPLVEVGDASQQQRFDAVGRRLKRGIFRPLGEDGPEHQAKKAPILSSELDIGKARAAERTYPAGRVMQKLQ